MSILSEAPSQPVESQPEATTRERFRSWRAKYLRIGSYPKGIFRTLLKSRAAPLIGSTLSLALFLGAALPDAGFKIDRYGFIAGLGILFILTEVFRSLVVGTSLDAYRKAARSIGYIVSDFAGKLSGVNAPTHEVIRNPAEAVGVMLRQAKSFVQDSLKVPEGELITATLLRPEFDTSGRLLGLREKEHDDLQPWRNRRILPLDIPALLTAWKGTASALPHTQAEPLFQRDPPAYRSSAYFPIFVGAEVPDGREGHDNVYAVIALESSEPYRFNERTVTKLEPFVTPIAQLIGLALTLDGRQQNGPAESKAHA